MTTLREAAQQALEALRVANAALGHPDNIAIMESAISALRAALAEPRPIHECYGDCPTNPQTCPNPCNFEGRPRPVQEPVAWTGYDLDGMVEAFSRVIEAHHSNKHPFHNPLDMDAKMALRILRGFIPAMKLYTAPPQRKPLTEEEIEDLYFDNFSMGELKAFARAIERAHGIT